MWTVGRVSRVAIDLPQLPPPPAQFFLATEVVPKLEFVTGETSGTERGFVNWKGVASSGVASQVDPCHANRVLVNQDFKWKIS